MENNNKQPFYKNYGCIASIFALIYLILDMAGCINIVPEQYNTIVNLLLSILIAAGLVSNPTDGKWYKSTNFDINDVIEQPEDGVEKNKKDAEK